MPEMVSSAETRAAAEGLGMLRPLLNGPKALLDPLHGEHNGVEPVAHVVGQEGQVLGLGLGGGGEVFRSDDQ